MAGIRDRPIPGYREVDANLVRRTATTATGGGARPGLESMIYLYPNCIVFTERFSAPFPPTC